MAGKDYGDEAKKKKKKKNNFDMSMSNYLVGRGARRLDMRS